MNWPDIPELWALLDRYEDRWKLTYPGLEIQREVLRMAEWCEANKRRAPKKNWKAFAVRWLARNQASMERAEAFAARQREQQRVDASVGSYREPTPAQQEQVRRDIAEILKRHPDLE